MRMIKIIFSVLIIACFCNGCVTGFNYPVSSTVQEGEVAGYWIISDGEDKVVVYIEKTVKSTYNLTSLEDGKIRFSNFFISQIDEHKYANVNLKNYKEYSPASDRVLSAYKDDLYFIFRYKLSGSDLLIYPISIETVKEDIASGRLVGELGDNCSPKMPQENDLKSKKNNMLSISCSIELIKNEDLTNYIANNSDRLFKEEFKALKIDL